MEYIRKQNVHMVCLLMVLSLQHTLFITISHQQLSGQFLIWLYLNAGLQGSPTFVKLRVTSWVPINAKGY